MDGIQNKSVLNVVKKVVGISPDGSRIPGYFNDERNRLRSGHRPRESVDSRLRSMKAYHAFLVHSDGSSCKAVSFVNETLAFVVGFDDKSLKRHALLGNRPLLGFPAGLQSMRQALGHGLEGNTDEEHDSDHYPVNRRTGRCGCLSSLKHGVCSSRGVCKHSRLVTLCQRASASAMAFAEVEMECVNTLLDFVKHRERSKPISIRCGPLYSCSDKSELLATLSLHPSVPPTGTSTGVEAGMEQTSPEEREYSCTFKVCQDLGLVFSRVCDEVPDIIVLCYSSTHGGAREGPASHEGDKIMPGDEVFFVAGVTGVLADAISDEGELVVPKTASGQLKMVFRRRAFGSIERDVGGRPCAKPAKFPSKRGSEGGAPGRKKQKNTMKPP